MTPTLTPFEAWHAQAFRQRDELGDEPAELIELKAKGGPAFTVFLGDQVVGCLGLILLWPGVAAAWASLAPELGRYGIWLTRNTRRILGDLILAYQLHRVEMTVVAGNERNARWAEALGFARENGRARQYLPNRKDVVRYERVEGSR